MHLVINGSDLGRQRGGNESYMIGMLDGMAVVAEESKVQISLIVANEGVRLVAEKPAWRAYRVIDVGPYRRLPFLLWQQTLTLRSLRPDWLVSTFFLPPITPCRAAVLIHDLSFRAHPEFFPRSIALYNRLLAGLAVQRADRVIALSEFTRQEISSFYPAAHHKSAVVYPGIGSEFTAGDDRGVDAGMLEALGVERPFLLCVGNIHPRKNMNRLLAAWERLRDGGKPVPRMVWAGIGRWKTGDLLPRAERAGVQALGFVPPSHLPALLRQAEALAYPSLYEGFGLPPVEAMACGTPVLTSNATSLPEAVGDAAICVDASDLKALTEGLSRVLFDTELRRTLRARGIARADRFTWERSARELLGALARVHS
jgi:glycosyltransferase involved in cell wall biosynthesis